MCKIMARLTKSWFVVGLLHRMKVTYICLVTVTVVALVNVSGLWGDVGSTDQKRRFIYKGGNEEFNDPSIPDHNQVADGLLAVDRISRLVKEKHDASKTLRDSPKYMEADLNKDFVGMLGESRDPAAESLHRDLRETIHNRRENGQKRSQFLRKNVLLGAGRHVAHPWSGVKSEKFARKITQSKTSLNNMGNLSRVQDKILGDRKKTLRDARRFTFPKASLRLHSKKTSRVNILIIAAMRTGSSFLGELFRQRADFFYMFEPGLLLMRKLDSLNLTRRVMYTKLIVMLHNFYHCQFKGSSFFIELLNKTKLHERLVKCPAVSERALEVACKNRANMAIKSIRILDLNLILSAIMDPKINLRVIHLVRDPRSMIISRLRIDMPTVKVFNATQLTDTYRNILIRYCSNWLQNYEIGHYVPFVRKNYLLVRYEDLALEPYVWAREIYEYAELGATIPEEVQAWIDKNTHFDHPHNKLMPYSTTRDSKALLLSWKRRLTLDMARAIEEVGDCTRLMHATGYMMIGRDQQMLESQDHLVGPLPAPQFNVSAFNFM